MSLINGHIVVGGHYSEGLNLWPNYHTCLCLRWSYFLTLHCSLLTAVYSPYFGRYPSITSSHSHPVSSRDKPRITNSLLTTRLINLKTNPIFGSKTLKKGGPKSRGSVLWLMITPKSIRHTRLCFHTWSLNNLSVNCLLVMLKNNPRLFFKRHWRTKIV